MWRPAASRSGYKGCMKAWLRWLLGCLGLWVYGPAAAFSITLLLSEPGGVHLEAAQALRQELEQQGNGWRIRQQLAAERQIEAGEDLVVAIGVRALTMVLAEPGLSPVVALLVPRLAYERLQPRPSTAGARAISALFLDQAAVRQIDLLQQALPKARRVGVLAGPDSAESLPALVEAARAIGWELRGHTLTGPAELFRSLETLADQVDVLLLLPEAMVVNRNTLHTLLLQSYRKRLPVLAYSAALTDAGALLGLYATPAQLGQELAQMIRVAVRGGELRLPPARHPETFTVRVNRNVARSLGLTLPSEADLSNRIR